MTPQQREAIGTQILDLLKVVSELQALLDADKMPDTFLEEMNAPYEVAFIAEVVPEIPNLEGVELLKERFELEQSPMLSTISDDLWIRFVKTIMLAGWTVERLQSSDTCKGIAFTAAENELLKNLECLRFMMLGKEIDLNQALGQNWVTDIEADVIKEFATKNNLK